MALGELLPDQPDRDNPGLIRAENCLPGARSYEPYPSPVDDPVITANLILSRPRGGAMLYDTNGDLHKFVGDEQNIYEGLQYENSFGSYGTLALDWYFIAWGDDFYATNQFNLIQTGLMGASTVADVTGSPTGATSIDVVRDFIMATQDQADPNAAKIVKWSALGDPTDWVPSITTQAGSQILQSGGRVLRVIGGEFATIFCERSIWRATYIGTPLIWQFDEVEKGRGLFDDSAVIRIGELFYYLDPKGFFVFDGVNSKAISSERINQTFFADFNRGQRRIIPAADEENNRLFWWYLSISGGWRCLVYNWTINRWSGPHNVDAGFAMFDDEKDAISIFPSTGAIHYATLTGPPLEALIETAEEQPNDKGQSIVNGVRPVVDGSSPVVSVELGSRDSTSGPVSYSALTPINPDGDWADVSAQARYHRSRFTVSGDFDHISDLEYDWRPTGGR